jgi:hypothetical protein
LDHFPSEEENANLAHKTQSLWLDPVDAKRVLMGTHPIITAMNASRVLQESSLRMEVLANPVPPMNIPTRMGHPNVCHVHVDQQQMPIGKTVLNVWSDNSQQPTGHAYHVPHHKSL